MNDSVNYNYSFSYNLNPATQAPAEEEFIAFEDCLEFPLPEQRVLIRGKHSGKHIIVTNDVAYSLRLCREFRTLPEHMQHLAQEIPELQDEPEDIRQVLDSIRQAGLMLSASGKARSIKPAAGFQPAEPDLCYCVLTCDRTGALSRLLDSMATNHRFRDQNTYYVIDDSRQQDNRDKNQATCEDFSAAHGVKLQYFGAKEQDQVLNQLKARLPEHVTGIDFLLRRYQQNPTLPSYGRTRNWGLLLGAGRKLVLIDDDILFQRVKPTAPEQGLAITSGPRTANFFSADKEWQKLLDTRHSDPSRGSFSQALGATLAQALPLIGNGSLPQNSFRDLHPADFTQVDADSRILLTSCGYAGDPGTTSNVWIYQLPANYRQQLLTSAQEYRYHITARNAWLGSFTHSFRNQCSLMSPLTGIDSSQLMPPYFPLLRNEDLLFGSMLHYLHPNGLFLDNPWAVPHLPAEHRQWEKDLALTPQSYGLLDFSSDALVLNAASPSVDSASERLLACANFFSSLSQLSDKTLDEQIAEQTLGLRTTQIIRLSKVLEESKEAPAFWTQDLQRIIQAGEQSLGAALPSGFQAVPGSKDEQKALARSLWNDFAQGIRGWEACMRVTKDIQIDAS